MSDDDRSGEWEDVTPTVPYHTVRPYLERIRRSSQAQSYAAGLAALEVLRLDGVTLEAGAVSEIEATATLVVKRHLHELVEDQTRHIQQALTDTTSDLISAERRAKEASRKTNALRKAILDFVRDGDLNKLRQAAYE